MQQTHFFRATKNDWEQDGSPSPCTATLPRTWTALMVVPKSSWSAEIKPPLSGPLIRFRLRL